MQLLCLGIFAFNQKEKEFSRYPQDLCELLAVKLNTLLMEMDVVTGKILNLQCIVCKSVKLLEGHTIYLCLCS